MSKGIAFTRAVSPRLAECETSQSFEGAIDAGRAIGQHAAYERALEEAGLEIIRLAPLDDCPDGMFVEDVALILGEHAVLTRPGAPSRAGEIATTAAGLAPHFTVHRLGGGRLDGGDVLRIGRTLHVGLSGRTDKAGIRALGELAAPLGYKVVPVRVSNCLHLKSAATRAGDLLIHNPDWVSAADFAGAEPMAVAPGEPLGANVLRIGATLIAAADSPRTAERLAERGIHVVTLDISEIRKADAALTCMSLIAERDAQDIRS